MPTLLASLRRSSRVCADTLDAAAVQRLGPFEDCTSNQAIALAAFATCETKEGADEQGQSVLAEAAALAVGDAEAEDANDVASIAVDYAAILLARRILPHISGSMHLQVDPRAAHDRAGIERSGARLCRIWRAMMPSAEHQRLVLKVPATYAGLAACRDLEQAGQRTLATTLFGPAQAILAGEARCAYVAPYVYDLRVHFEQSFVDQAPAFALCPAIQRYYASDGLKTHTLPASLTIATDCMRLAGADYITITPPLLDALNKQQSTEDHTNREYVSVFEQSQTEDEMKEWDKMKVQIQALEAGTEAQREGKFDCLMSEREKDRLSAALETFCSMQTKLEEMMQPYVQQCKTG